MVWPAGRNESFRFRAARIDFRGGQFESHRRCHKGGALVLFSNDGRERGLLAADCLHQRRAAVGEFLGVAHHASRESASHDGALSWRTASAAGAVAAISFSAVEIVGKHGRPSSGFPRRANAGKGRPVVLDGAGAETLPVAGRIAFDDDRVRNGALNGSGLLGCPGNVVLFLASVSAAAGFPGNSAARVSDDSFGSDGDVRSVCSVARTTAG